MKKIYLNILGLKNFETDELEELEKAVSEVNIPYSSILYEPAKELKRKISIIQTKRRTSKQVWVRFVCSWSGYSNNPSAPRRTLGVEYKKLNREIAEKLPKYYCYRFSDGSTNDWNIEIVSVKGKEQGSDYPYQVDELLKSKQVKN